MVGAVLVLEPPGDEFRNFIDTPLFQLLGKTLIEHYMSLFKKLDIRNVYLLSKVEISEPLPEECRLLTSINVLKEDDTYLVIPLNVYVPYDALSILVSYHLSSGSEVTVQLASCENAANLYTVDVDSSSGRVITVRKVEEEKPDIVLTGILVCEGKHVKRIVQETYEYITELSRQGVSIEKSYWTGTWCKVETPWDLLNLAKTILTTEFEPGLYIHPKAKISPRALIETREGPVVIDEEVVIDHDVIIKGPAYIGKRTYIGNGALIRNFTVIESDCTVGSNVDLNETVILNRTTIGRGAYISCSVIGQDVVIEPGVVIRAVRGSTSRTVRGRGIVKQGAVIGSGSRVGAYAVLDSGIFVKKNSEIKPLTFYTG